MFTVCYVSLLDMQVMYNIRVVCSREFLHDMCREVMSHDLGGAKT